MNRDMLKSDPAVGTTPYRPDIDGLRSVSIILILACHLQMPWATGGFIGVDTFFVISGFVIHKGLLQDIERGSFSLSLFYWRRIRRIIPSLSATILACLVAGLFVLTPGQLAQTSERSAGMPSSPPKRRAAAS